MNFPLPTVADPEVQQTFDQISLAWPSLVPKANLAINVKDHGAKGDGTTDDSAAIQAAIDRANTAGGGTVFVPRTPDYYKIVARIAMKTKVRLTGEGYGSTLQKDATDNDDVIRADGVSEFEIDHLRVRNSTMNSEVDVPGGGAAFCVRITNNSSRGSVHHCFIDRSWLGVGVHLFGTPSYQIDVDNNFVRDMGCNGISVYSDGTDIRVEHNQIRAFGQTASLAIIGAGVEWVGTVGGSVSHNMIRDGNYGSVAAVDGIRFSDEPSAKVVCVGNDVGNVAGHLIRASMVSGFTIAHNQLHGSTVAACHGIYLLASAGGNSTANTVSHNVISGVDVGVRLEGQGGGTVHANTFEGQVVTASAYGYELNAACNDNDIRGGLIKGNSNIGVLHNSGSRTRFRGMVVCENTGRGFHIPVGTEVELIECHAYDKQATRTQTYGLNISAGVTGTQVVGGRYGPNLTGTILDAGTGTVQTGVRAAYS